MLATYIVVSFWISTFCRWCFSHAQLRFICHGTLWEKSQLVFRTSSSSFFFLSVYFLSKLDIRICICTFKWSELNSDWSYLLIAGNGKIELLKFRFFSSIKMRKKNSVNVRSSTLLVWVFLNKLFVSDKKMSATSSEGDGHRYQRRMNYYNDHRIQRVGVVRQTRKRSLNRVAGLLTQNTNTTNFVGKIYVHVYM